MEKRVLVGIPNFASNCSEGLALLLEHGFTVDMNPHQRSFRPEELQPIIGGYTAVISELERWDEALFSQAHSLKILSRNGVGLDNIDLPAARRAGVLITYAKGMNAASVANMAVGLMLAALKKIAHMDRGLRQGCWCSEIGHDLDGRTIGFLGFGQIAQETAKRLSGFPVSMMAYDPYQPEETFVGTGVQKAELDQVLRTCGVISIHLPHSEQTHHIIGPDALSIMRPDAVLINTSRGGLVDQQALYRALVDDKIAAAGIDVYEHEPLDPLDPLLTLDNIVCTPHVSGNTKEACQKVGYQVAKDIVAFFEGRAPELVAQWNE